MTTASIMTQSVSTFSVQSTSRQEQLMAGTQTNLFDSFLSQKLNMSQENSQDVAQTDSEKASTYETPQTMQATQNVQEATDKTTQQNATQSETNVTEQTTSEEITEDGQLTSEEQKLLSEVEESVKAILKEILGITDEELEQLMAESGITVWNLFQPEALTDFVVQATGAGDVTAVLTDESLQDKLTHLSQHIGMKVQEIAETLNIPNENVEKLLQTLEKQPELLSNETIQQEAFATIPEAEQLLKAEVEKRPTVVVENNVQQEVSEETSNAVTNLNQEQMSNSSENMQEDKGTSSQQNSGRRDTAEALSGKQTITGEQILQNLAQSVGQKADFTEQIAQARQMQNIVNQVVEQIKVSIRAESTSMELQLNPESLGKVNLLVSAKEGVMTAQFTAQNEVAKAAIESQMQTLKDNLNNQGLKVESIEVNISDFSFEQGPQTGQQEQEQKNAGKRMIRLNDLDNLGITLSEEEMLLADMMREDGNQLNYMA